VPSWGSTPVPITLSRFAGISRYSGNSHCATTVRHQRLPALADIQERPTEIGLRIGFFHIADDGLSAIVHMDVLNADKLLPAVTQASKNLNLSCISPHQT
jgi:hypothetical protein